MQTGNVPFNQLTDEQKGWILLQAHKGAQIQIYKEFDQTWYNVVGNPKWLPSDKYRVQPTPRTIRFERTIRDKVLTISVQEDPTSMELFDFKIEKVSEV